jgi:hypothetical protein
MSERFECSVASAARGEPIHATASQVKAWLLVEVQGSWGRDAIHDSELGPHAPKVWRQAMSSRGVRVITIRRDLDRSSKHTVEGVRVVHVVAGRPGTTVATAHRAVLDDLHHVVAATESIANGHGPDAGWAADDERYVLVCTNGRHDACCATYGRPLVRDLRDGPWGQHVWECSHIGGDRFAGNVLVLPASLYFGRCRGEDAARILGALDAGRLDLGNFRGRSALTLAEQAAEHFTRTELGLDGLDDVVAIRTSDAGRIELDLADGRAAVVSLERSRRPSPTPLTCKGAEGLSYPTLDLAGLELRT